MAADIATLTIEVDSTGVVRAREDLGRLTGAGQQSATAATSTASAWSRFGGVMASLGLGVVIKELVQIADTMSLLDSRLKMSTNSSAEFMAAQAEIYRIAQKNNVGIKETTELYVKLADPIRSLGGTTREVAAISESFAASLRVGGASAQEASAATRQFAQAMASGVLRGDEFNSIAEASPRFMKAMADGIGVPTGALRKMAEEGKLTADVVGNALVGGLSKLQAESASMPDTVGGAFQRLNNDIAVTIARFNDVAGTAVTKFNEATGATEALADAVSVVSRILLQLSTVTLSSLSDGVTKAGDGFELLSSSIRVVGTVFETLMALGFNVSFVLKGVGRELGGIGAQLAALATGEFKAFSSIRQEMVSESEAARAALDRETASIVGMTEKALQARDIVKNFSLSQAEAANEMARLTARTNAVSGAFVTLQGTQSPEKTKKVVDEYKKLMQSIQEKIALQGAEIASEVPLTNAQRLRVQVTLDLAKAGRFLSATEQKLLDASIEQLRVGDQTITQRKVDLEWERKTGEENIKTIEATRAKTDALKGQLEASKFEIQTIGKTASAIAKLESAKLSDAAATAERNALIAEDIDLSGDLSKKYREQAATLRELASSKVDAASGKEAYDAEKKRLDDIKEEWKKTTDSINNSLTDALMRGFENGKGFAENLRDTIKNMFKTLILRPVISAVVNPVSQGITSLFGGGGSAGAGGGLGGLGGIGGLGSLIGGAGSLLGGLGGLGGLTAGFQGATLAAGLAGPTTAGASGLMGLGSTLGAGASALGTAIPYIGVALALYSMFKTKKTPHLGSAVNANASGATTDRRDYLAGNYNAETDSALRFLTLGSVGSLNKLDTMFGGAGGFTANAKFAADNKDASAADATIFRGGREVSALGGEGYKLYTPNAEEAFKAFTKDFDGLTLQAIKSLEKLPAYAKAEFDKLGDSATTEGIGILVDQIGVFQGQLSSMKMAIGSLGSASDDALASIIANVGGIQQFSAAVDVYYTNFFSEAERLAFSTSQLSLEFSRLGVTMPTSREDFKNLVESIDKTSESGVKLYSSMLGLAGSFASIVPAAESAKVAAATIAEVVKAPPAPTFEPFPAAYGAYVRDGVTYITGNAADLQAAAAAKTADALGGVTSALGDAAGAWKSVGDAITDEVRRIRGEMAGFEKQGESFALAQFATLTAQARAGDINAAKLLPKASQDYLKLAGDNAGSLLDFRRAQGATLSSLLDTQSVLGLTTSTTYTTPSTTYPGVSLPPGASGASFDALVAEVRALKAALESALAIGNINTRKTADILVRVTEGGDVMKTREEA